MSRLLRIATAILALWGVVAVAHGEDGQAGAGGSGEPVFAVVNGTSIPSAYFDTQLNLLIREKFFHRRPTEEQLGTLRREAGDRLIDRLLLLAEARRRGLQPDAEKVRRSVERFEERNRANARWKEMREQLLPMLEQEMAEEDLLEQIEKSASQPPDPQPGPLRQFYEGNRDLFTEPERVRLSIILLKVDPGLSKPEKAKILERGRELQARLAADADFAALAKEYSEDVTAANGGDMGYVHVGMLGEEVNKAIGQLAPGAISDPIVLMEGVAILRLGERLPAKLKSFEESQERAVKLWQRETSEQQWKQLKASLRKAAKVEIVDASRYPEPEAPKP